MAEPTDPEAKPRLEALSDFRYQLRIFLRFSEDAAREEGITALQYQLLLHTHAFPGRKWATIGELAERLQAKHHGTVALVSRCEEAGLVRREKDPDDRRAVRVHLTASGDQQLAKLARLHRDELASLAQVFRVTRLAQFNDRD